jgi:hypothetical protein
VVAAVMAPTTPVAVALTPADARIPNIPILAHSCMFTGATETDFADPPIRLKQFLDLFPGRSAAEDICQTDLSSGADAIGQLIASSVTTCLGGPADDRCTVEDAVGDVATPIPACTANSGPATCWMLRADAELCPSLDHQLLVVVRNTPAAANAVVRMRCPG